MRTAVRSTVDRLDKPSAYYQSRVSALGNALHLFELVRDTDPLQNKRRRDRDDEADAPSEPPADPLANATTLYVGNL